MRDMQNGEVREYKGKKYKYVELPQKVNDTDFIELGCKRCAFKLNCTPEMNPFLGECYEGTREDGKNGMYVEEVE